MEFITYLKRFCFPVNQRVQFQFPIVCLEFERTNFPKKKKSIILNEFVYREKKKTKKKNVDIINNIRIELANVQRPGMRKLLLIANKFEEEKD